MDEWIELNDEYGTKYKNITTNGEWQVIKCYGDAACYSFCPFCGYTHACYKEPRREDGSWGFPIYAPEKEFNYCPMCGTDMRKEV